MSLAPKMKKHLHPVLKELGFTEVDKSWRIKKDNWIILVEMRSRKFGDEGLYELIMDVGFFSRELDEIMGWRQEAGYPSDQLPFGILNCHFWKSLFDVDNEGVWQGYGDLILLPKDSDKDFEKYAEKLKHVIPKLFARYASFESLIEAKTDGIGRESKSKQSSIYAAAACYALSRYDEAYEFLNVAVRPGSISFMKNVGARLREKIDRACS